MYKIGVVGDKDSVLAFKALGVEVKIANTPGESRNHIDNMAKDDYAVIFVTEQVAQKIPETIERYNHKIVPSIILIPSNKGTLNIGMDNISKNVEKAVGSNII